jgi:hypothetical protein
LIWFDFIWFGLVWFHLVLHKCGSPMMIK